MIFEDVFPNSNLLQPWLGDFPTCQSNVILSTLSSGNCGDGSFGILSVADSEAGPFETPQGHGLWYEGNQCMIQEPTGAC